MQVPQKIDERGSSSSFSAFVDGEEYPVSRFPLWKPRSPHVSFSKSKLITILLQYFFSD
jgi:hypothetical protein